jgi:hypothetical protein
MEQKIFRDRAVGFIIVAGHGLFGYLRLAQASNWRK